MEYLIREATKEDMNAVLDLIQELADFEKESHAVEVTVEELQKDGFGNKPLFKCFVAETDQNIIGMALIYPRYSTWKGAIIHLEDLIVNKAYRGKGIGDALLNTVVTYGHQQGVKRINWEVIDWNEPAIKFYEKKGAKVMRDWDVVQLDAVGIANIVNGITKA